MIITFARRKTILEVTAGRSNDAEDQAINEDRTGLRTKDHRIEGMTSSRYKHIMA